MDSVISQSGRSPAQRRSVASSQIVSGRSSSAPRERAWVGVRVRPLLESEQLARERAAWRVVSGTKLQAAPPERPSSSGGMAPSTAAHAGSAPSFTFSRVWSERASDARVAADATRGLVPGALRGLSTTVLTYGPRGGGKSRTSAALVRAVGDELFDALAEAQPGREYLVRISALELFREVARDLLRDGCGGPGLRLTEDAARGVVADGATVAPAADATQLRALLDAVDARRRTRAARVDDSSCRSHVVISLHVESRQTRCSALDGAAAKGRPKILLESTTAAGADRRDCVSDVTCATLQFVDLASPAQHSPPQAASGVGGVGDAARDSSQEVASTEKSLSALNAVVRALADNPGKRHVPYRDSKLTRLLSGTLSGAGRLVVIICASPAASAADETRTALHFGTAAARVVARPQPVCVPLDASAFGSLQRQEAALTMRLAQLKQSSAVADDDAHGGDSASERDAVQEELRSLQLQILQGQGGGGGGGDSPAKQLRASLDSRGLRASWAPASGDAGKAALLQPGSSGGGSGGGDARRLRDNTGSSNVRRSMRLLDAYLLRDSSAGGDSSSCGGGSSAGMAPSTPSAAAAAAAASGDSAAASLQQQMPQPRALHALPRGAAAGAQQQAWQGAGSGGSFLERAAAAVAVAAAQRGEQQQQQEQQTAGQVKSGAVVRPLPGGSRLNPANTLRAEDSQRVLQTQMQMLQEPCGPEAEAAMAGLEVEVRCYKAVQEYTLAELSAALEHLESQRAAGQGLGSWSNEQLDALRSEVSRKRAAAELTQLGDRALEALTRKVSSYTSSADNSPFADLRRGGGQRGSTGSSGGEAAAAAAAAAAALREALSSTAAASDAPLPVPADAPGTVVQPQQQMGTLLRTTSSPQLPASSSSEGMLSSPGAASADICSPHGHESAQQPGSTFAVTGTVAAVPAPSTPLIAAAQAVSCVSGTPGAPTVAHGCGGATGAATTSSGGSASCGSSGASSRRTTASMLPGSIIGSESAADATQAQAQLTRMQEAWRESVEKDVSCLREVLGQYKEQVERLEMQKRLLLSQVLKLEFALEEEEARADALEAAVMRGGGTGTASAAAAAAVGDTSIPQAPALSVNTSPPLGVGLGAFDAASDDGWAATPTVGSLLPRIVSLWQELYVPLAYRSRFFLAFRGREVFYYEVEARRLEWKRAQMLAGAPDDGGSGWQDATLARRSAGAEGSTGTGTPPCGTGGSTPRPCSSAAAAAALTASSTFTSGTRRRSRQLDKAARALDWERKSLAAALKWNLTEAGREELYRSWGVDPDTKERKLQLVFKLWSRDTLQQPDGMARSSELVVALCGMDASEHMLELVFGSHLREYSAAGLAPLSRTSTGGLGLAVSNIVRRLAPPLARAGPGCVANSGLAARGSASLGTGLMGGAGPVRAGGSFTSRLQSGFLSLLSSRDDGEPGGSGVAAAPSREGSFSSLASSMQQRRPAA